MVIKKYYDTPAQFERNTWPDPGIFLSTAEIYNEVAAATGVAYEDQAFADVLDQRDLKSDTVHPNATGYRQIAGVIHARLVELGAL